MSKRFSSLKSAERTKKKCEFVPWNLEDLVPEHIQNGNVQDALKYICDLSPYIKQSGEMPLIAMKNQLYSVMASRTAVDQGVSHLRETGVIRVFKTSLGQDQFCIMFTIDYIKHITEQFKATCKGEEQPKCLTRFLEEVLSNPTDITVEKEFLIDKHGFKDSDVTELIKIGVLNVKDAGSWWLAIPSVGCFLKILRKGRQAIIQIIRRTKYREINYKMLLSRKPPTSLKFGFQYHVHDLIGADLVRCINSTTGVLLRIVND
ncbi:winged helix repair factor 1-like [Clavelina lepadiformis]|uniref:winged helix repair factor 1-like n=1 Tax=Clavelina lepadiformis TaxID=159417 RepID=UPI0040419127